MMKWEKRLFSKAAVWRAVLLAVMVIVFLMGVLSGCGTEEGEPVITLEGPDEVEITLGEPYPEHGFQARDAEGKDITGRVQLDVPDLDVVGDQFVKYTVTDKGKTVTASRILKIRHKKPNLDDWEAAAEYYNKGIPILMYHYVYNPADPPDNLNANYISTTDLESHLQYLVEEDYYFPTWREVRAFVDGEIDLPEKSIVLTFDDGNKSFIEHGIPLLEDYDVKATAFVIASKNGEEMAAMDLQNVQLQSHSFDMHRGGGSIGHGGIFTALYAEDALADLKQSIEILGNGDAFAYPFGDYTEYCMMTVEEAGFLCAVTTEYGKAYPGSRPYALPRVRVSLGNDLETFVEMIE